MDGSSDHYLDMLQIAYEEIKAYDPNIIVLGPAVSNLYDHSGAEAGGRLLRELYEKGASAYFDAISIHMYEVCLTGYNPAKTASEYVLKAEEKFPGKPIWVTEIGTIGETDHNQVASYLQAYCSSFESGNLKPDTVMWHRFWGNQSTMIENGQPTVVYYAFQEFTLV
jgi:hypothetical protein